LKVFVGSPADAGRVDLVIDDVILFANDPDLPPEPEPFPERVLYLAAFDTGITPDVQARYWPGEFEIDTTDLPAGAYWGVARAVERRDGHGKWLRLQIDPTTQVGEHTKLRFSYYLDGAAKLLVQIFDATDQDNRHVQLHNLAQRQWQTVYVDFTNDARRNDGSSTPFAAGHVVDDLFFFVEPESAEPLELLIDEVVLFDAGTDR
jgi:hypothetical protein